MIERINPQEQSAPGQTSTINPKYAGVIKVRDRSQPLCDRLAPTAEISLSPSNEVFIAEFMGMSAAEYHASHTGKRVLHTRRADGNPVVGEGNLRNMLVIAGDQVTARVMIDGCHKSQIALLMDDRSETLECHAAGPCLFYRGNEVRIRLRILGNGGAEAAFEVQSEHWLHPVMAVAHHLWCKVWA
jgi:hypothetical protein